VLVAILDSGVTLDHPHIGNVVGGIAITPQGNFSEYTDWLGHGTAVAAAIHEKNPAAGLLIVKIFGRQLTATIDQLILGLEWALDQRASFINLSLGTQNRNHSDRLQSVIARAQESGSRIVSARTLGDAPCFPGSLPGVIGVEVDSTLPRDQIRYSDDLAFASPFPRPIPGVPPERNLHGISFAVANVTGYLSAQAMKASQTNSFENVG
jgi:subtilisin family serine protease